MIMFLLSHVFLIFVSSNIEVGYLSLYLEILYMPLTELILISLTSWEQVAHRKLSSVQLHQEHHLCPLLYNPSCSKGNSVLYKYLSNVSFSTVRTQQGKGVQLTGGTLKTSEISHIP